jgi:signal transduction histidine kinase
MSFGSGAVKKRAPAKPLDDEEDDRRRIARELHDDIGQRLALLADDAARLRQELKLSDGANRDRLDKLVQQAQQLGEDLRRISHNLHPAILEDLGLVPAMRLLLDDFTCRTGMHVDRSGLNVPLDLPANLSAALYRITQEALRNVSKHAGHTSVQISLGVAHGEIVLVISDAGSGFDSRRQSGLGLTSMRERVRQAGGQMRVISAPGKGTTLHVHLPLSKAGC